MCTKKQSDVLLVNVVKYGEIIDNPIKTKGENSSKNDSYLT